MLERRTEGRIIIEEIERAREQRWKQKVRQAGRGEQWSDTTRVINTQIEMHVVFVCFIVCSQPL